MKQLSIVAVLLATAFTAMAAELGRSINVYGVLCVNSSAEETIVAVPWVGSGTGAETAVKLADVVQTANLNAGDLLYMYDGSAYKAWVLATNSSESLEWTPTKVVSGNGVSVGDAASVQTLSRGGAFLLKRQKPASCFYICGQVGSSSPSATLAAGSAQTAVFSLLAPPVASASSINDAQGWDATCADDVIWIPSSAGAAVKCRYRETANGYKWCRLTVNATTGAEEWSAEGATIPVGQGAWYERHGTTDLTISWPKAPSVE